MTIRSFTIRSKYLIAFLSLLLGILGSGNISRAAQQSAEEIAGSVPFLGRMLIPGTQDLQLVVELSDPALIERMKVSSAGQSETSGPLRDRSRRMNFAGPGIPGYRQQIRRSQESLKKRILDVPGAEILGTTETVMNSIILRVPAARYQAIRHLPGVKKVYFSRPRRMLLDKAAIIQNAQDFWRMAGGQSHAGQGAKIAILDSGIDVTHPMFSGTGLTTPPGFPKNTPAGQVLTNSKVIVARSYVPYFYYPQTIQTAEDEDGHGTFVAGCAAGESVNAPLGTISGMAPGAFLGSYKIFGTPGVNDSTTAAAVLKALDDAVADGMDIINLSMGALDYLLPEDDPEYAGLKGAVDAGVILAIAAGNDGPGIHTINSPGVLPEAITVGAATNSHRWLPTLRANDPNLPAMGYKPGDGAEISADIPFTKIVDVASLDGDGLGCLSIPAGSLLNAIAFVKRGTCTFYTKVVNASDAGAKAVVVYNNEGIALIGMGGLGATAIPAVMISNPDGLTLRQYIASNSATAQVAIDNANTPHLASGQAKIISDFSGIGPGTDFSIKPDLVAVGEDVYSATSSTAINSPLYDASRFTGAMGTSFSTPMVAGAAAVLLQIHPTLGAQEIKSLLTTTASRNLTVDGTNVPDVLHAGSGLLNLGNAAAAGAVFSPTSLSFGAHSYSGTLTLRAKLTIENISSSPDSYSIGLEPLVSGPAITFSSSNTGTIAPKSSTTIDITLQISAPNTGGYQGFVTAKSASTSFVYRIPYWAGLYVPDSTRVLPVLQTASGSGSFISLNDALAAAQPGNIIEIQDDGEYSTGTTGLALSTNPQGIPLHGLTIRAAAGKAPIIRVASGRTGIGIVGLQNILLQGLTIEGGYTGIEILQPSAHIPTSVTIDRCTIRNTSGNNYATGVFVYGGGNIEITNSTITGSTGSGVEAGDFAEGTQLTISGTTISGHQAHGMFVNDTNLNIDNSIFQQNVGRGLYAGNCTGTVANSKFLSNATYDYYGVGMQISGGNLTVRNNRFEYNDYMGISLTGSSTPDSGPKVRLTGNTIRGNGYYGISSNTVNSLAADRNLIKDNVGGILLRATNNALLTNNIIAGSTGSSIGYGVRIDSGANARLVNNTIYKNALAGISLTSGTASVFNSIIGSNRGGDLAGISISSTQSCLTGSADSVFANAAADDYSPASGSLAIDAGSNTVSDLPFLDYYGRLRVASATRMPGEGTVDIGAVEANSAYPLVYPLAVNGSEKTLGNVFETGIAFTNPNSTAANLRFSAYDASGSLVTGSANPSLKILEAGGQIPILMFELFGFKIDFSAMGSVLGSSDSPTNGFVLFFDSAFSQFATGANASTKLGNDMVFMRHQSDSTRMASYIVSNPGVNTANITATLYNSGGSKIGQPKTATIPAKGSTVFRFDSTALSSGYVRIQSDRPVAGIELVGNNKAMAALGGFSPGTQKQLFFPHFAVGESYSTQVGIINTSNTFANLTLSAYDNSGNFLGKVDFSDRNALAPGGQLLKTVTELFNIPVDGPLKQGYLVAQSDQEGIMGFTDFSCNNGLYTPDATIPADSVPSRRLLFSHVAQGVGGYMTGIALLNPFGTSFNYTISVYNGAGTLIAKADKIIGPHEKVSKVLTHPQPDAGFFTFTGNLGQGHVEVTSDYGLIGLELFFTDNLSQLASVPAQIED
jgi:minor extracellular serine protease Vpr